LDPVDGASGNEVFLDVEGMTETVVVAVEREEQRFDKRTTQSGYRKRLLPLKDREQCTVSAGGWRGVVSHDTNE
jgi:hypothetical protein